MKLMATALVRDVGDAGDACSSGKLCGRGRGLSGFILIVLALAAASPVFAQDLSYQPINPTFGGNPFNSSHLLGVAGAQNDFRDPRAVATNSSQADVFARQLQSRLLSALSSQIVDAIFGENPQEKGTITFGDQTIDFVRSLDSVTLNIANTGVNEVTTIVVPTFIAVN